MPIKYETIPFDATRVDEKGVKVITRDGQNVKILFTALPNERPVFGVVSPNSKNVAPHSWYENGQYRSDKAPHDLDLFLKVPIERKAKSYTFTAEQIRYLTIARDKVEVTLGSGIDDPEDESIYKKALEFLNGLIDKWLAVDKKRRSSSLNLKPAKEDETILRLFQEEYPISFFLNFD